MAEIAEIIKGGSMETSELKMEQWVPSPLEKVFAFFSDAKNLEVLTPPWVHFRVLHMSTPAIQEGTLIDYRLRIKGIPIKWQSRIVEWTPNVGFVDVQTKGPYAIWHHTHAFEKSGGGTLMRDKVKFAVPLGAIGKFLVGGMVSRDVNKIFQFRKVAIESCFGTSQ